MSFLSPARDGKHTMLRVPVSIIILFIETFLEFFLRKMIFLLLRKHTVMCSNDDDMPVLPRILFKDKDRNWDDIESKLRAESDIPLLKTSNKVRLVNPT